MTWGVLLSLTAAAGVSSDAKHASLYPRGAKDAWAPHGGITRHVMILTKHSESCFKPVGNMFWLATKDLPCLGMPMAFCGSNCGTLNINGQDFKITQLNPTDGQDVCG